MIKDIQKKDLLLISIKPQYAEKIFKGEKTIELRKSSPIKAEKNSIVLIYVTSPVKELWGICKVENITKGSPAQIWKSFGDKTGISKQEFNTYYKNTIKGVAIELKDVKSLKSNSISLNVLRKVISGFTPPQTFAYLNMKQVNSEILNQLLT